MSFEPKTRLEKILCGVSGAADNARTRIEKAVAVAMTSIASAVELPIVTTTDNGEFLGVSSGKWTKVPAPSDNVIVAFTVTTDEQGAHASTTANLADTISAIADGKNILAKVHLSGMVFCGGLTTVYPETDPTALSFCIVANTAEPGAAPAPQLMKITWSADGATAEIANLAVATQ